jgi:16S rRNA (guanine966-N2)-methyltransferase
VIRHSQVRIIGGRWRGRKLYFPPAPDLRPTADRVRETLFNWLAPVIVGTRCLDLFAGSGALGIEALSRGARELVLVEKGRQAHAALRENLARLGAQPGEAVCAEAMEWLGGEASPFDVVFLDPPYGKGLLEPCCRLLEGGGWLARPAWVYLEAPTETELARLPAGWELRKRGAAGAVRYALATTGGTR